MANEFRKVTDQNGVDHPVTDDARVTWTANGVLGAKNRLPVKIDTLKASNTSGTWNDNAYTLNNVTFTCTVDSDNNVTQISVTTNSSASANTYFTVAPSGTLTKYLSVGEKYTLSGCPSGGSASTYYLYNGTGSDNIRDFGNECDFTWSSTANTGMFIYIASGVSMSNSIFKPMIRLATDTDSTYQPYAMTNRELTEKVDIAKTSRNTSTFSVTLDAGDVYLVFAGGGGVSDKLTSTQYGYVGIVCREPYNNNMLYGNIHKGSDVTPSVSDYTFTLTATTAIAMGAIKLNKAVEV